MDITVVPTKKSYKKKLLFFLHQIKYKNKISNETIVEP